MRLPRRILVGLAVTGVGLMSASAVTLATRPASSDTQPESVTLVAPAADLPEQVVDRPAPVDERVAVRAETAATRAEGAAVRAEVAAVHVDEVVVPLLTTTTTTAVTTVTSSTTIEKPQLIQVPNPSTTTTTVPEKRWVTLASIPVHSDYDSTMPAPISVNLTMVTGEIRVTGLPDAELSNGLIRSKGHTYAWWAGTDPGPSGYCPGGDIVAVDGPECSDTPTWEPGQRTLTIGTWDPGVNGNPAGWRAPYNRIGGTGTILVQELR